MGAKAAGALGLTSVLMAGWSEANRGITEARRIKAQNKARIAQMQEQFALNTQNLHNNNIGIQQNRLKNDLRIEESKLDSQDAFAQAFIGSGISGRTQDIMEAQMQGAVSKAHNEAAGIATQEEDRQFLGLKRSSDEIQANLKNLESFSTSAMESNMNMAMLQAGVSSAAAFI